MPDEKNELPTLLHDILRPYILRLLDLEIIAATDARAAASIVKMLLDKSSGKDSAPAEDGDSEDSGEYVSRTEMLELLRRTAKQYAEGRAQTPVCKREAPAGEDAPDRASGPDTAEAGS